jgi:hypothetical protein
MLAFLADMGIRVAAGYRDRDRGAIAILGRSKSGATSSVARNWPDPSAWKSVKLRSIAIDDNKFLFHGDSGSPILVCLQTVFVRAGKQICRQESVDSIRNWLRLRHAAKSDDCFGASNVGAMSARNDAVLHAAKNGWCSIPFTHEYFEWRCANDSERYSLHGEMLLHRVIQPSSVKRSMWTEKMNPASQLSA